MFQIKMAKIKLAQLLNKKKEKGGSDGISENQELQG